MAGIFNSESTDIVSSDAQKALATGNTKSSTKALLNPFLYSFHQPELYMSSQFSAVVGVEVPWALLKLIVCLLKRGESLVDGHCHQTISHLSLYIGVHHSCGGLIVSFVFFFTTLLFCQADDCDAAAC